MSEKGTASDGNSAPSSTAPEPVPAPAAPASPPSSDSGDKAAPTPSATDSPSPSSSEKNTHQSDREGLLAAVRSVIKTSPEKPTDKSDDADEFGLGTAGDKPQDKPGVVAEPGAPPVDGSSPDKTAAPAPDDANLPDPTEAELAKLRPETRKRFERLLAQRNQARRELEALQPELTEHRTLKGYLTQNQLAPDDVNMLLGVGAALRRGDFKAFLDGVTPYVMTAQEALGLRLPKDLQSQVDQGLLSTEAAADMTRMRWRAGSAEARLNEQVATSTRQNQEALIGQVKTAVDNWEATIRSRDPDYAQKAVAVRRFAQALLQERGSPRSPQEAVNLIQNAYDEASRELARIRPPPKPTRPVPASSQGSTVTATREPQTMKEAALRALAGMRKAV